MEEPSPAGFWPELVAAIRQEMRPPLSAFFVSTPTAPIRGVLQGNQVILRCNSSFVLEMVNKPEVLALVARKAGTVLGKQVAVKAVDASAGPGNSEKMEQLLNFGRAHSDVIKIKE